ncbi:MAG TPA: hypothetical protein GX007_07680 [Bacteroidales bacterium]|jgi:hypothetical protein|nr:hypothetical protein [Bacteroidales bacterium]
MKNNIFKSLILLVFTAFLCISCDQEQFNLNTKIKVIKYNNGLKSDVEMLAFRDFEEFFQTMKDLDERTLEHILSFNEKHQGLTEDEYNYMIDSLCFNEEQILDDFQSSCNFKQSMRTKFNILESIWLDNDSLDQSLDPIKQYPFSSIEMTLLNEYGEVKIGDGILKMLDSGYIYITDGSLITLSSFNNGDNSVLNQSNVNSGFNSLFDCLLIAYENLPYHYFDGNKMARMHLHFHTYVVDVVSNTNLTIYRKNNSNGKWRKWAMYMTVGNTTFFFNNQCEYDSGIYEPNRSANTKSLSNHCYKLNLNNCQWLRAKNNASVCGNFYWSTYHVRDVLSW